MSRAAAPSHDGLVVPQRVAHRCVPKRKEIVRAHRSLYADVHGSTIIVAKKWNPMECLSTGEWVWNVLEHEGTSCSSKINGERMLPRQQWILKTCWTKRTRHKRPRDLWLHHCKVSTTGRSQRQEADQQAPWRGRLGAGARWLVMKWCFFWGCKNVLRWTVLMVTQLWKYQKLLNRTPYFIYFWGIVYI